MSLPNTQPVKFPRPGCRRSGSILIAVMIGLAVGVMLLTAMVKAAFISRQYLRLHLHRQQAYWLCEAGLERAAHFVKATPEYQGESWKPTLPPGSAGGSTIIIEKVSEERNQWRVTSRFPVGHPNAVQCSKTIILKRASSP